MIFVILQIVQDNFILTTLWMNTRQRLCENHLNHLNCLNMIHHLRWSTIDENSFRLSLRDVINTKETLSELAFQWERIFENQILRVSQISLRDNDLFLSRLRFALTTKRDHVRDSLDSTLNDHIFKQLDFEIAKKLHQATLLENLMIYYRLDILHLLTILVVELSLDLSRVDVLKVDLSLKFARLTTSSSFSIKDLTFDMFIIFKSFDVSCAFDSFMIFSQIVHQLITNRDELLQFFVRRESI